MIQTTVNKEHRCSIGESIEYEHNKKECRGKILELLVLGGMPAYRVEYDDGRDFGGSDVPVHIIYEYQVDFE